MWWLRLGSLTWLADDLKVWTKSLLQLLKTLSHLVFILELRIPSPSRFNLVPLLGSSCLIAHASRSGRLGSLRQTPLSQGCRAQTCPLKLCELPLIRQCSNYDKEPGWQSLVLAAVRLCQRLCSHALESGSLCESRRWSRGFNLWLTRHPTWCLRTESQLLEAVWLWRVDRFITLLDRVLTRALWDVCRWGQQDSSKCWWNAFCSERETFVFGIITFR